MDPDRPALRNRVRARVNDVVADPARQQLFPGRQAGRSGADDQGLALSEAVCGVLIPRRSPGGWLATSEDLPSHYVFGLDDPPSWAHDASWVRVRKPNLVRM